MSSFAFHRLLTYLSIVMPIYIARGAHRSIFKAVILIRITVYFKRKNSANIEHTVLRELHGLDRMLC